MFLNNNPQSENATDVCVWLTVTDSDSMTIKLIKKCVSRKKEEFNSKIKCV